MNNFFQEKILGSGARFLSIPLPKGMPLTALVLVNVGSRYEAPELNGISHFVEHMLFKGTKKRPSYLDISSELDALGANYNAFTSKEVTAFYIKASPQNFFPALDVLADIVSHSTFPAAEIEKERGVILEEMKMVEDMPQRYVIDLFEKLLYAPDPLSQLIIGPAKNISRFQQEDFLAFFHQHYRGPKMAIAIAGDKTKMPLAEKKIQDYFAQPEAEKGKEKKARPVGKPYSRPILFLTKKTGQVHACLGAQTGGLEDKDRFALKVLAIILGGNMSSRLFVEVREKRGLAYYVRCFQELYQGKGYLAIHLGADPTKIVTALKLAREEIEKIAQQGVTEEELQRAKKYIQGITALSLETSDQWAHFVAEQAVLEKKVKSPAALLNQIKKVSLADIQQAVKKYFSGSSWRLAAIGPRAAEKDLEKFFK